MPRFASPPFAALAAALVLAAAACSPRTRPAPGTAPRPTERGARGANQPNSLDPAAVYAQAGLLAESQPIPFVGNIQYLAGRTADSTLALVTLSLPNRALTFTNEGEGQQAKYIVAIDVRQGAATVRHIDAHETVRVASFRETSRGDESIIFQQYIALAPGQYVAAVSVRDEGSARSGQHETLIVVPRLAAAALSSPIAVYQAAPRTSTDSLPQLIANPRATVIFGRDSTASLYLEGYALPPQSRVTLAAVGERNSVVWRDTVEFGRPPAGGARVQADVVTIPVARLGVGRFTVTAARNGTDSVRTPLFVTFSDEWAVASFDEMLSYLRHFATPQRIQSLRDATAEGRAAAWGAFYRETDPDPRTPEHEGLRDYFRRIQVANERFREEGGPGWLTDRGRVYATLGDPDQVFEQTESSLTQRGRAQIWTYSQHRLQLVFIDQTGFGRWRLTASSEADFSVVAGRERK